MSGIMERNGMSYISINDERYPNRLRQIYKPPNGLYFYGRLPEWTGVSLAVIGARACSIYGKEISIFFARELSLYGVKIISGMARGIDGYAHHGALMGSGETYAVLGSGVDVCYPYEHKAMYENIMVNGGVLSEYEPKSKPLAMHFPERNRIISGLSDGILVVEAREKSGSMITVEHGLEQGKDIFVLPGRIQDELSKGCNRLLKAGAIPVTEPKDILEYYGISSDKKKANVKKNNKLLEKEEQIVYSKLCLEPKHISQIIEETYLNPGVVIKRLIDLERNGFCMQPVKNYFIKQLE